MVIFDISLRVRDASPDAMDSAQKIIQSELFLDIVCPRNRDSLVRHIQLSTHKKAEGSGMRFFRFGGVLGDVSMPAGYSVMSQHDIPVGDYTVWEDVPDGWALTDVSCVGGDCTPTSSGTPGSIR